MCLKMCHTFGAEAGVRSCVLLAGLQCTRAWRPCGNCCACRRIAVRVPQLPFEVWEQIAGFCEAQDWVKGAGMACKALQTVQPKRLEVSCLDRMRSKDVRLVCMALQWTAQHWSLAQEVRLELHCSSEMLNAHPDQERLALALHACMHAPPPDELRALQLHSLGLSVVLREQPAQHLVGALHGWLGCMQQLRLLCVGFLPAPAVLQQLPRLRHFSVTHQAPQQDVLEAVLAALPGGLQTLELPVVCHRWAEDGVAPIDLMRFSQLIHVACNYDQTKLRLPRSCRLHKSVRLSVLHPQLGANKRFADQTSVDVCCMWRKDGNVQDALSVMLQCMTRLDTLQLRVSCPGKGGPNAADGDANAELLHNAVLQLPGPFWRCASALTILTVMVWQGYGNSRSHLIGHLHLTVPASLRLRELVLHAKLLSLEFEDLQHSAASLDIMRLVYLERSGFCQVDLENVFAKRGLRLEVCQLDAKSYHWTSHKHVQYTCMYIVGCHGAKPRDVKEVPCVCGACYDCVLSKFQLE